MDREKVIKALEVCRDQDNPPGYRFTSCKDDCPYYKNGCARKLKEDSAELLKEHESRWMSMPHKKDRVCERCGYDEPYKNAEKETMIYKFCPNCGARMKDGDGG